MREPILVLDAGSSSLEYSVFETAADGSLAAGAHGQIAGIGMPALRLMATDAQGRPLAEEPVSAGDHRGAITAIHNWFAGHIGTANEAGGPRISTADAAVSAWVVATDENLMVARHTRHLLDGMKMH